MAASGFTGGFIVILLSWVDIQTLALNAEDDSPGEATPATLSSLRGKRGLNIEYLELLNIKQKPNRVQTPLCGEAGERVPLAEGGLAGESSTPGYLHHSPTIIEHLFIFKNSISRA